MDTVTLDAKKRETQGSRSSRRIRGGGRVPAVLYGHGMKPLSLDVDRRAFAKALKTRAGENVIINLNVEGAQLEESTCLIRDIQHHPVTDDVQHIDFTVISLKEKIEVQVPLVTLNAEEAIGVKEGGILDIVHHEIPIECLPTDIPEHIEVNVKAMKIGDAVHVSDLQVQGDITFLLDDDEVLIAIHPPRKEEEKAVEGEEGPTQPEVIEKGKKEDKEEEEGKKEGAKK